MASFKENVRYQNGAQNAEISASSSEIFFSSSADNSGKSQYGSFNSLEITNNSSIRIFVDMDGLTTRRRTIQANSSMVIDAESGIFFDTLKVTNSSGSTAITAGDIQLIARIVQLERA